MIILEGPDLGGKSTVGKMLSDMLGLKLHHFGGPPKSSVELITRISLAPRKVIYDRHPCISEIIYGQLPGRTPLISQGYAISYLKTLDPIIFYCNPGWEYLKTKLHFLKNKPHKSQNHVIAVHQNYKFIYDRYEGYMHSLKADVNIVNIDFRTTTKNQLMEAINEHYRH